MASDRGRKQTTLRAGEARQKSRWIPPGIQESKREGQEDEERGKTNVVDVVEDKERWTQPTLTTPGPLLRDAQSPPGHGRHRAACTQSERLLVTETPPTTNYCRFSLFLFLCHDFVFQLTTVGHVPVGRRHRYALAHPGRRRVCSPTTQTRRRLSSCQAVQRTLRSTSRYATKSAPSRCHPRMLCEH